MAAIVPAAALAACHRDAGAFVARCWQNFEVVTASAVIASLLFTQERCIESLHVYPDCDCDGFDKARRISPGVAVQSGLT
jgi:hypothetical protein